MGISEFTVHNVLRTYSRQDQLGRVQRARPRRPAGPAPADQVTLSSSGRKVQWLGQLAAEVVERRSPELSGEARAEQVVGTKRELLERHAAEIGDEALTPEVLAARLTPLYLG